MTTLSVDKSKLTTLINAVSEVTAKVSTKRPAGTYLLKHSIKLVVANANAMGHITLKTDDVVRIPAKKLDVETSAEVRFTKVNKSTTACVGVLVIHGDTVGKFGITVADAYNIVKISRKL